MKIAAAVIMSAFVLSSSAAQARVYHGQPDLALTVSVVTAGGGPQSFSTLRLLRSVAGPNLARELRVLKNRHGAQAVADMPVTLDFLIDDALRVVTAKHIVLPAPNPPPASRHALVRAMWFAGVSHNSFDVGTMLERMLSHQVHHAIMADTDANPSIGHARNESAHILLAEMMNDLAAADHLRR
jgi:hypothetical protein